MTKRTRKTLATLADEAKPPRGRVLHAHELPPLPLAAVSPPAPAPATRAGKIDAAAIGAALDKISERGWRRLVGWSCAGLMVVLVGRIGFGLSIPGPGELAALFSVLFAFAGLRTYEKVQGTAG